jgi:hypothetical protein
MNENLKQFLVRFVHMTQILIYAITTYLRQQSKTNMYSGRD